MRNSSFDGPWPGIIGGLVAVAATLVLRTAAGTRLFAELIVDASTFGLQPRGFSFFLDLFASAAKPLLFLTVVAAEVALFAASWRNLALRLLARTSVWRATAVSALAAAAVLLLASVALVALTPASLGSHTSWPGYALVTLAACASYAFVAGAYASAGGAVGAGDALPGRDSSRRAFIMRVPVFLLGGVALVVIGRRIFEATGGGVQAPSHYGHETPDVTPNQDFYIVSKNLIDPGINAPDWRLRVGGAVSKMLELSYDDVKAIPSVQHYTTLQCISNEVGGDLMSNALWTGLPLHALLDMAQVRTEATYVLFRSEDDYMESLELDRARQDEVVLVYEMNGAPLPQKHGFPLRLLVPGKYGMRNPKWITEIMLMNGNKEGYWEQRDWSPLADMKTACRIDVPSPGDTISAPIRVHGVAFSGNRGISKVEVSTDNGATWDEATLQPPLSPYTWVIWYYDWQQIPTSKADVSVVARATDGQGALQVSDEAPPYPDGATGYPRVPVSLRPASG